MPCRHPIGVHLRHLPLDLGGAHKAFILNFLEDGDRSVGFVKISVIFMTVNARCHIKSTQKNGPMLCHSQNIKLSHSLNVAHALGNFYYVDEQCLIPLSTMK
jgi:hypothetical protein